MRRFVLSPRSCVIATGLLMCSTSSLSAGTVTITFTEDGGGAGVISVSFSGSLNFGTGSSSHFGFPYYINPAGGTVGFTAGSSVASQAWGNGSGFSVTSTSTTPAAGYAFAGYGTSGYVASVLQNVTGDQLGLFSNGISVGQGVTSGQAISGSATLSGTFASRGISAGTFTTNFTLDGQANTLTFQTIAASAVPGSAGPAALIGLAGMSRRRRR